VREQSRQQQSGISLKTLIIAAAASATAAIVVPMFWEPGTVFAAAMTPIIVSIVSELLKHPTEKVSTVTSRRTKAGTAVVPAMPPDEPFDPLAPAPADELQALPRTTTPRAVHGRRGLSGRQWRLALVTGLVAFVGAVAFVTASELLAGERVGSASNPTTFFGKERRDREPSTPTPTATPTGDAEETPVPTPTASPTPSATTTAPTATPTPAAPAPQSAPPATPTPTP
jgi:hypothetical protein